jgi:hypothetical protein
VLVTLAASTYELQFYFATFDLGSTVCLKDTEVRSFAEAFGDGLCQINATSHNDYINVGTLAVQENVAHITANDIALQAETVGFFTHEVKDRKVYFRMGGKHKWLLDALWAIGYWVLDAPSGLLDIGYWTPFGLLVIGYR